MWTGRITSEFTGSVTRVYINGLHTKALVDTGADTSCISQSFLNKAFVTKPHLQKSHTYPILGVGQTRLRMILGQINLAIQINGKCFKFDFHVIDNLPHSLIIGIDF
jgi:hypothetical protein